MENNELKTCPFCGGKAEVVSYIVFGKIKSYFVHCLKCGCQSRDYTTKQNAAKYWNRRKTNIKELTEENERLNASCTELARNMQDSVRVENEELRKSQECDWGDEEWQLSENLRENYKYCPRCGQRIDWDHDDLYDEERRDKNEDNI